MVYCHPYLKCKKMVTFWVNCSQIVPFSEGHSFFLHNHVYEKKSTLNNHVYETVPLGTKIVSLRVPYYSQIVLLGVLFRCVFFFWVSPFGIIFISAQIGVFIQFYINRKDYKAWKVMCQSQLIWIEIGRVKNGCDCNFKLNKTWISS